MDFLTILWHLLILLMSFALINYGIALVLKRNDVADVSWGIGFILVCLYFYISGSTSPLALLVYLLVVLWGFRLSFYIGIRNSKKEEDFRYKKWRMQWGKHFYWRSLLQVFVLQMLILLVISSPIIVAAIAEESAYLSLLQVIGIVGWIAGFMWQAIADYQLSAFKRKNTGKVLSSGLWKYSRHPNYFGEIVMWWSLFLMVLEIEHGIWAIISPVLITYLLTSVSGVPMLEEKYKTNDEYRAYVDRTPSIFPFFK
ncbi:MAG: DUF1295 domain-containing protein [Reichenbachiella sp.]|uniref:DUF1295 domain-containing protein n=1 Tax=Reichenbachiella sp. TaxID=2184521 RepID=UPI003264CC85